MFKNFGKRALAFILAAATVFTLLPVMPFASLLPEVTEEQVTHVHAATTVNVLDGQVAVTDSVGTGKVSDGTVTITVTSSTFTRKTNNITIINETQSKATLTFDYNASNIDTSESGGFTLNNDVTSGTWSVILDAGASLTFSLRAPRGFGNKTATLTLSNFSLVAVADSSNITFNYDSALGSVKVGDTAVAAGGTANFTADGATITATPVSGATFIGWVYEDGTVISREPAYLFAPSGDATVKAIFVNSSSAAYFLAGNTHLLSDLNAAADIAAGTSNKTVVLMNSATLPAGDYTIPSGVTLLIPYNDAHTLCTTAPNIATGSAFDTLANISAYRTLTMATGANITVNGAISVSGTQHAGGRYCGNTSGPLGYIKMNTGSTITINDGAFLYAWGYIIGDGTVTGKSGATVYESFQITDWRGGSVTSKVAQDTQGVFPMCQYFVQNIEVPMTLEAGAKEYAFMSVNITLVGIQDSAVPFIGDSNSGAMFRVAEGSVTKKYDGTTDRLIVSANGQVSIEPLKMSMKLGLMGETELDSAKFNLPITNNMTVVAEAGTMTVNQDMAILPGAQVIVKKDATCVLGSGKSIFVYDSQVWGNYVGSTNLKFKILPHAPSRTYTRTEADLVDAYIQIDGTMDASKGYLYTTTGGANIISTGGGRVIMQPGTATHTYQMTQGEDDVTYVEVPVTSAMLKNGNGNFVITSVSAGTFAYDAVAGQWIKDPCDHVYTETIIKQPSCATEGTKSFTCQDAACGHSYTQAIATISHTAGAEATCTTAQTCTECGEELAPAKGHTSGPDATCTTAQTCTVCGAELNGVQPHSYSDVVTAPTCTEQGYTTHTCSVCGDSYVDTYVDATGHTHGPAADCENPQTCTKCGAEIAPANGHNYTSSVTAPTCTERGYTTHTCSTCGDSYVDTYVDANGHAYVDHEGKAPTCTETGWAAYQTCENCDYTSYQELPAAAHVLVDEFAKAPTCTEAGYNDHKKCMNCDYTEGKVETPALGHNHVGTVTTPATCLTAGIKTFTCSRCPDSYTEVIPAIGHTEETIPAVAPTCTATGLTEGKKCSVCGAITVAQQTVERIPHSLIQVEAKDATCEETGWNAYEYCSVCDYTTYAEIPAKGHAYTGVVTTDPTCTQKGEKTYTCTACSDQYTEEVAALGHNMVHQAEQEATCTQPGISAGGVCSRCDHTEDRGEIPALGHNWVVSVREEATCTADGKIVYVCDRTDCDEENASKVEILVAKGHTCTQVAAKDATCEEIGWNAYEYCSVCDYTTYAEIPAKGHTKVQIPAVTPTCTATGLTAGEKCSVCQKILAAQEEVDALGHDYQAVVTAPTCTQDGYTTHTCSRCEDTYTSDPVSKLGHVEIVDAYVAPTCTTTGLTEGKHCERCNAVLIKQNVISALGHAEVVDQAVAPTCTATGLTEGKHCSTCGEVLKAQEVEPATGHSPVQHNAKDATCTEKGWSAYETCENCDYTTYVEIPATGHSIVNHDAKAVTCTEIGWDAYETCEKCNHTTYAEIPAVGHSITHHDAKEATCTEIGWDAYDSCNRCDYTTYSEQPIKAHTYTAVVTAPTCTVAGYTTHTCSGCSHSYVDSQIAPVGHDMAPATCTKPSTCKNGCGLTEGQSLGHKVVIDEEVQALCEDSGLTEGSHCEVCGEVLIQQEIIPALGHKILYFDAKKPTYTGVGWNAYEKCSRCAYSTYVEIPALGMPTIWDYETFMANLALLEELTESYVAQYPGKDPVALMIKYIRTGVERYNSGSWGMMAGYEDAEFAQYIFAMEDEFNSVAQSEEEMLMVSGLKNLESFYLPNGDYVDFGHMFGMMDITYHNRFSVNHADVAGWAGDLVDLLSLSDQFGVSGTLEEMITDITANYLLKSEFQEHPIDGAFSLTDMYGDMDGFYIMDRLSKVQYEFGKLCEIFQEYFAETLTTEYRISYFLDNRLDSVSLRGDIRTAVYNAYTGNKVVATLEGTREFASDDLLTLKKACCYAFADYLCRIAGDYVELTENPYYDVFSSESSTLAPGITQKIQFATSADGKQMAYYLATADLTRDDVHIFANYNNNDPASGWAMQRVLDQANAAQKKYGDPSSPNYVSNYNVIASINGAGYDMETGEPVGVLVMNGIEYQPVNWNGFFGILKDGTPVIGTTEEYNTVYQGQVQEAIAGFGAVLIKDGQIQIAKSDNHRSDRASRTAIGITKTGKVVFMVLDGRQEPFSCGGSMEEIAQIMLEAGCVNAINLDGGGSTTYVAKQEGEDTLSVINRPSDGSARSVSTSLIMVSTAPNSKAFDHAILDVKTNYLTVGSSLQIKAEGVSATGNAAPLPEGTTWALSDARWGTITEDGVFTALRNGDVDVYLMLGDEVIGSTTLHVVIPNNIYFTKSKIDAVYGEKVELPVKALYDGKEVAIRAEDLVFTLEVPAAGTIQGFVFVGDEQSKVRSTKITVALASDPSKTASTSLALYYQGETSFDFEQATGGDRQLAWDRVVSNSTTHDAITYSVVDPDKDMVTSYIFAIDMTQIPIPQRLEDLIYMLPGSDVEGASAWTFLLQLAQRVSVLTEVKPVIYFDPNFDVDYSNLTLVNEYFDLHAVNFDEASNSLTLTLKWKKQTQAIDPNTANPMCIVNGIKLTPKANADWSEKGSLTAVHSGKVGYTIYLRAGTLYTFAQKPENQAAYGLMPFVNPDDSSETGASFGDTYTEFQDTYTLVRMLKNGWVNEEGGFAYYVDGEKLTGVQLVEGYYYDFGDNGINIGQTKYSGLFWDESVRTYRYAMIGTLTSGWKLIDDQWYHFWKENCCASVGTHYWGDVDYTFDETGRLTSGVWKEMDGGTRYYYGPTYYYKTWATINGNQYYFNPEGYRCEGYCIVKDSWTNPNQMYHFTQDGALVEKLTSTGLLDTGDKLYYLIDGIAQYGLYKIDGYYYYFNSSFAAVTGTYYVNQTNGLMPQGEYVFDEEGRMVLPTEPEPEPEPEVKNGLVAEDDGLYYYVDGVKTYAGLIEIDGDYYYINSKCKAVTGTYYAYKNNDLMPQSDYRFGEDGKMIMEDGLHIIRGERYYYKDGQLNYAGLIKLNGNYYYINSKFKAVTGTYYAYKNNGLMPQADYEFASDGRMLVNGLVEEDGKRYYYENGILTYAGLIKIDGYYYYINGKFQAVTGTYYIFKTNGIMAQSNREFGEDGKMILNGLVEENGGRYYYKDGKLFYAGLIEIDGDFYYINSKYKAVTGTYYVNKSNGLMPQAEYQFGEDGKMILPGTPAPDPTPDPDPEPGVKNGIVTEGGQMYYYVNGVKTYAGLIEIDGDYYYVNSKYKVVTGVYYISKNNGLMPQAEYIFADDGKMIGPVIYS